MQLTPGVSIDEISLGMAKNEMLELLGFPDRQAIDDGNPLIIVWIYNALKLKVTLSRSAQRVVRVQTTSQQLKYKRTLIIASNAIMPNRFLDSRSRRGRLKISAEFGFTPIMSMEFCLRKNMVLSGNSLWRPHCPIILC